MGRIIIHFGLFVFLTLLTQVGGVVYLLVLWLSGRFKLRAYTFFPVFLIAYIITSFATIYVAPVFGRVPLSCFNNESAPYKIATPLYCVLNRQYITPRLRDMIDALGTDMGVKFASSKPVILDANFPFFDGFPLLPHLSHDDGRKIDLAFLYADYDGNNVGTELRSPIGYWAFEEPQVGRSQPCSRRNDWVTMRWDMQFLQPLWPNYRLDELRTKWILEWLVTEGTNYGMAKVLLEPHIKEQLGLTSDLIRFQGCRAARHDDHIHVQVVE